MKLSALFNFSIYHALVDDAEVSLGKERAPNCIEARRKEIANSRTAASLGGKQKYPAC